MLRSGMLAEQVGVSPRALHCDEQRRLLEYRLGGLIEVTASHP